MMAVAAPVACAAATSAASTTAASVTSAAAATTATTATATGQSQFLSGWGSSSIFLVENIERRQANVGEFLLAKKEFVTL